VLEDAHHFYWTSVSAGPPAANQSCAEYVSESKICRPNERKPRTKIYFPNYQLHIGLDDILIRAISVDLCDSQLATCFTKTFGMRFGSDQRREQKLPSEIAQWPSRRHYKHHYVTDYLVQSASVASRPDSSRHARQ
jgi:hypothetical protein